MGDTDSASFFVCFSRIKNLLDRTETRIRDTEDVHSVDTNSLRQLPRRLSKNCDLQFENSAVFKENYSIDE